MKTTEQVELAQSLAFPADFVWGVATSAFQIEGANREDGRGECIWDRFCATPGKTLNGDNGAIANDHYHLYPQDIQLMKQLNVGAYRFSVAWARIFPQGTGSVNSKGLDFYDRLVDNLLEAGIDPYITLYHWDLPQALQDKGGWPARETAYAFADYAEVLAKRLGDRAKGWITLNEPWCSSFMGYRSGSHAPGFKDHSLSLKAIHNLLLGHGLAVERIRANSNKPVGITLNLWPIYPADPQDPQDIEAAHRVDTEYNRLFLEPIFKGTYPQDYVDKQEPGAFPIQPGDMELISVPLDFLGINYYNRHVIRAVDSNPAQPQFVKPEGIYTAMGWEVYPEGLHRILSRVHRDYNPPKIYITENGASTDDVLNDQRQVEDDLRLSYLQGHFQQLHRAISEGVPVAGYFAWSLMDNFEWSWGYSRRFGIVYVDFETQERIIKKSGHWYAKVAASNEVS